MTKSQRPLKRRAIAAGALVIVGLFAPACSSTNDKSALTEEQQIEAAVKSFYEAWSSGGAKAALALSCEASRTEFDQASKDELAVLDDVEIELVKMENIKVVGDSAHVDVTTKATYKGEAQKPSTENSLLKKEDGKWKPCDDMTEEK
ncbi:nuclear transport factor 2 family protein [Antrihabitans stalactiti]|uniref:DUF4878 domain-containing protein n=1 Tax=Antrihabitans stalactiti TaxID=2584121 RepID=A0A848KHG5_9NOCA|nr:nuclear transport factor 2 family protein [Antrihabitans stalactiti]NMN98473.1 DUF4878 domain-containing protein [Antrihabitans stalactiti]